MTSISYPSGNRYFISDDIKLSLIDTLRYAHNIDIEDKKQEDSKDPCFELELYESYVGYIINRTLPIINRMDTRSIATIEEFHQALTYFGDDELLSRLYNSISKLYSDSYKLAANDNAVYNAYQRPIVERFFANIIKNHGHRFNASDIETSDRFYDEGLLDGKFISANIPDYVIHRFINSNPKTEDSMSFWHYMNYTCARHPSIIERYHAYIPNGRIYEFANDAQANRYFLLIDWNNILFNEKISEDFISRHIAQFNGIVWENYKRKRKHIRAFSSVFLRTYHNLLDWRVCASQPNLSDDLLSYLVQTNPAYYMHCFSKRATLPINLIRQYTNFINWASLSSVYPIDEAFHREFASRLDYNIVWHGSLLSFEYTASIMHQMIGELVRRQPIDEKTQDAEYLALHGAEMELDDEYDEDEEDQKLIERMRHIHYCKQIIKINIVDNDEDHEKLGFLNYRDMPMEFFNKYKNILYHKAYYYKNRYAEQIIAQNSQVDPYEGTYISTYMWLDLQANEHLRNFDTIEKIYRHLAPSLNVYHDCCDEFVRSYHGYYCQEAAIEWAKENMPLYTFSNQIYRLM